MATQATELEQLVTVANTALGSQSDAYLDGDVPTPRPDRYVSLGIARRFGGEARLSTRLGRKGRRVLVRSVARTDSDARLMQQKVQDAFEGLFIGTATKPTPVAFETEEEVGPDDGWFSGLVSYTYTSQEHA